jgi:hypothetical protein
MKTKLQTQLHYALLVEAARRYVSARWSLNLLFFILSVAASAQEKGMLKLTALDARTREAIPLVNVELIKDSVPAAIAVTDFDGNAVLKAGPGKYVVKVSMVGYETKKVMGVWLFAEKLSYLTVKLNVAATQLQTVTVVDYKVPIIDPDTKSGGTVDRETFQAMPSGTARREYFQAMSDKSLNSVVSTQAGVYQQDAGYSISIRGARPGATSYFVDGERVIGTKNLPQQAIEQISLPMGGLPAQFGSAEEALLAEQQPEFPVAYTHQPPPNPTPTVAPVYYPQYEEEYGVYVENGYNAVSSSPLSTFAIDVDGASYTNARRMLTQGYLPPKDAVRIEEFINYFKYEYPQVSGDKPFGIFHEYNECPWNKSHRLLQVVLKGKEVDVSQSPPNHFVFLIDVSGSMQPENRLPLLKRAFSLLVKQLRAEDRISIVVYAGSSGLVLEAVNGT